MAEIEIGSKKYVSRKMIIIGLLFSLVLISSSILFIINPFVSDEKVAYFSKQHPIIYNGKIVAEEAIVKDSVVYLPLSFVKNVIDPAVYYDKNSDSIIITTENKVIQIGNNELEYYINEDSFQLEIPAHITSNNKIYLAFEPLHNIYPFEVKLLNGTGAVQVVKDGEMQLHGLVRNKDNVDKLRLRTEPSLRSPYVETLSTNEEIIIEGEQKDFYFVRKTDGIAGFIKKDMIKEGEKETIHLEYERVEKPNRSLDELVNLTWEAVYTKNPPISSLGEIPGLNVVSPTWFSLKNEDGDITNLGSVEYANWAKENNLQIWGLFSNDFDPAKTHEALEDFSTRKKMIRQLLQYSEMYHLDGINIDFENVNLEDGRLLTQFVRELTPYLHQAGLVVSMDITFISTSENWSKFYEREKLASVVDYLIVMAYDEHWASSPEAGSVASLPWVEENLVSLLTVVPNEKLILGIPFYTRIWEEKVNENGDVEVTSKALSMESVTQLIDEKNLEPQFDDQAGQNYVEFKENNSVFKIWIEDETSIQSRALLVQEYKLAGIASWNRHFANQEAWVTIDHHLNKKIAKNVD